MVGEGENKAGFRLSVWLLGLLVLLPFATQVSFFPAQRLSMFSVPKAYKTEQSMVLRLFYKGHLRREINDPIVAHVASKAIKDQNLNTHIASELAMSDLVNALAATKHLKVDSGQFVLRTLDNESGHWQDSILAALPLFLQGQ